MTVKPGALAAADQTERLLIIAQTLGLVGDGQTVTVSTANRLGEIIGIDGRTVFRWCAGTRPVPDGVYRAIAERIAARAGQILSLAEEVAKL